jgi:hypothetical protein
MMDKGMSIKEMHDIPKLLKKVVHEKYPEWDDNLKNLIVYSSAIGFMFMREFFAEETYWLLGNLCCNCSPYRADLDVSQCALASNHFGVRVKDIGHLQGVVSEKRPLVIWFETNEGERVDLIDQAVWEEADRAEIQEAMNRCIEFDTLRNALAEAHAELHKAREGKE